MKVTLKGPAELMDERVLSAVPSGKVVSEKVLLARLSKGTSAYGREVPAAIERLLHRGEVMSYSVPAPILKFDPAVRYYTRATKIEALRDQSGVDKKDQNVQAILRHENGFIAPATLFMNPKMPAHWQQQTVLARDGQLIAIGSFGEVAKAYLTNIKSGRGKMVIHRMGTKFEPNPNKLLNGFKAAIKKAKK